MGCPKLSYYEEKTTPFLGVWKNPGIQNFGVSWYDYGHRFYDSQLARFTAQDLEAEKFPWQNSYCYAANNPIKFIDILGDSATFQGTGAQNAINFLNTQLAGFYTFSVNANGVVTMTAVPQQNNQQSGNGQQGNQQNGQQNAQQPQITKEQQAFANQLNNIINGNGMTTINMVNNDNNTLIGDVDTHTMDVGDIQQIGNGQYIDQMGSFIHEANEQYRVQVRNLDTGIAHILATSTESSVTGTGYDYNRQLSAPPNGTGTITVPVQIGLGQWHNVIINYQNGNVTSVIR